MSDKLSKLVPLITDNEADYRRARRNLPAPGDPMRIRLERDLQALCDLLVLVLLGEDFLE